MVTGSDDQLSLELLAVTSTNQTVALQVIVALGISPAELEKA
jgi:hypothetical protein